MRIVVIAFAALAIAAAHAGNRIERSTAELRAFQRETPCPATGRHRGACPGWQIDHTIPLCAGGEDKRQNMKWLTIEDHRFKTVVDVKECRKLKRLANTPAREHAD
jgi:5-methylcytosine-specific restriction endonuclease McrA